MALQRKTWTDAQVEALTTAVIDQKMSCPIAQRAGEAGELDLPPFKMPLSTVQYHVKAERKRRARDRLPQVARDGLGIAVNAYTERLLTVAETLTNELVAEGAKAQVAQAIQVTRLVQELAKLDRPTKTPTRGTTKGTKPASKSPDSFVASLAAQLPSDTPPTTSGSPASQEDRESEPPASPATSPNDETTPPVPQNGVSTLVSAVLPARFARP
jgi:hypothetical protein